MKKSYLVMAAAAALFAACSSNDLVEEKSPQVTQPTNDGAVVFDSYVSRGTTRAGLTGLMNDTQLKLEKASGGGFGVFGYYTDGERYAGTSKPNFFYNQGVFWNSSTSLWEYTPIKYWPNEFGNDAISDQIDRVSLFAYAPYVDVDPTSGYVTTNNTENITALTRNNATGDPHVKYTATMDPTNTVDLCYGVAAEHFTSSNSTSFPNDIAAGKPYIDVTKPDLSGKIKFDFKHALAKLNVQIDAVVNNVTAGTAVDSKTKIWVRSVTFEGITMKGALNLNSIGGSPEWYQIDASGDNKISTGSVTVYDGLKDGREPIGTAATELPASLNRAIIQSAKYNTTSGNLDTDDANVTGVTKDLQNLFKNSYSGASTDKEEPVYVIPTGEQMKVTIVYDVETYDPNIAFYLSDGTTQGSTIQNTITKTVDNFTALEAGKQYILKLHLGMRTVDFEAKVTNWDTPANEADTDLPSNLPSYAAVETSDGTEAIGTISIAAKETDFDFQVRDLNATSSLGIGTSTTFTGVTNNGSDASSNASGVARIKGQFGAVNNDVKNATGTVLVLDAGAPKKGGTITVVQKAHELGLGVEGESLTSGVYNLATDDATFVLTSTASDYSAWDAVGKVASVKVYDAAAPGTELVQGTAYTWTVGTKTIVITGALPSASSKTFIIKVKAGDAPEETIKVKVTTTT